jgi:hypothetical protein
MASHDPENFFVGHRLAAQILFSDRLLGMMKSVRLHARYGPVTSTRRFSCSRVPVGNSTSDDLTPSGLRLAERGGYSFFSRRATSSALSLLLNAEIRK